MRKYFYIIFASLVASQSWAQTTARILKPKFQIGEQTTIIYELNVAGEKDKINFTPKSTLITCDRLDINGKKVKSDKINLEIIGNFEDSISKDKSWRWTGKYKITAWDTGYFEIPKMNIVLNDSTLIFDAIKFNVISPTLIDGQGIYETEVPFLEIPSDPFYWLKQNWWWITLLAIGISALIFYLRKTKYKTPLAFKEMSLKERTLRAIDGLDQSRLWEKQQLKTHYVELSYILKSYLSARYKLNLLERTTNETTILLIANGLSQEVVSTIQLILNQSDLVKFAKSSPDEDTIAKISAFAKQIVVETSPIIFDV